MASSEINTSPAVDALKRPQAESRRGLHPPLNALMEPQMKIDTSPFILSPIEAEIHQNNHHYKRNGSMTLLCR